jgi:subtilase family serine protease
MAQESESVSNSGSGAFNAIQDHPTVALCAPVRAGGMRCHATMRTDVKNNASPQGFTPSQLVEAYNLPSSGGAGTTVAIVDANDDPNAESDLAVYRAQFGLPPCTTANGCFKKVNQNGVQGSYPTADAGWAGEISLDLDMVSAACPSCKILLVEASSANTDDLGTAVNTAASLGASAISNSYGGPEDSTVVAASSQYYNHPGILVTASSGDSGYGANFPATSQYVLGVGGTSLVQTSSNARGWAETAWNSGSSGCSAFIPKPSWQTDKGCTMRTVADVAAVADPNTGVAVYDTYGGQGGWNVYGGTSVASPLVAAIFAVTGQTGAPNSFPYSHQSDFNDVTSGSDGSCGGTYLCTAGPGYDGPTGWGTPNGALIAAGGGGPVDSGAPLDSGAPADSGTADTGSGAVDSGPADSGAPDSGEPDTGSGEPDAGEPSTCSHPICTKGNKLVASCDPCATEVCAADSYCCSTLWDRVCVREVTTICGETCH